MARTDLLLLVTGILVCFGDAYMKGMSVTSWGDPPFDSEASIQSLRNLRATNVEWIAVVVNYYQKNINATEIYADPPASPTVAGLENFLRNATSLGFKIFLKPHVDPKDGQWRAWIGSNFTPEEWTEWFKSYSAYILQFAAVAEKLKVDLFSVGTEMISASPREAEFRALIKQVRAVYSGNVTYASNWGSKYQATYHMADEAEFDNVKWFDALDVIGLDAYYYLTDAKDPNTNELITAWKPIVKHIDAVSKQWKKKVVLTEIGYRSIEGAAVHPGWWNGTVAVNVTQQVVCYEAAFNSFSNQSWFEGVFWWAWSSNPNDGGLNNDDYTIQNKPAQVTLKDLYSKK